MSESLSPEFSLIDRYFNWGASSALVLGIGDDCAIADVGAGQRLCYSMDTLVEGTHFLTGASPESIAARSLGSALSDLAAMGACPHSFTLSLTLPRLDEIWLRRFSNRLRALSEAYGVCLAGGDTTRGPLAVCIQVHGFLPVREALLRSGASLGDRVFVSGTLGDAAGGLKCLMGQGVCDDFLIQRFEEPMPQLSLGQLLRPIASSAIDISDGLVADLRHIARASGCGIELDARSIPLSEALVRSFPSDALSLALSGGDDYELAFTLPSDVEFGFVAELVEKGCRELGRVVEGEGVHLTHLPDGLVLSGYDHFSGGDA